MPTSEVIQIIVQGGAVGLLLAFGWGGYKLMTRAMEYVNTLVSNHLNHIQTEIGKVGGSVDRLADAILVSTERFGEHRGRLEHDIEELKRIMQNNAKIGEYFLGVIDQSEEWQQNAPRPRRPLPRKED